MNPAEAVLHEAQELAKVHARHRQRLSRGQHQTRARWELLSALDEQRTVPQVARLLGLARQSVQRTADVLAEAGLLRFVANPGHRRSSLLRVTEAGARARDRLDREIRGWDSHLEGVLEPEDLETTLLVLRALRSALER